MYIRKETLLSICTTINCGILNVIEFAQDRNGGLKKHVFLHDIGCQYT